MAIINAGTMKDWKDGDKVFAADYKQDREILRVAINDNHARITTLESDVPALTTRITSAETKNSQQDTRLTNLETGSNIHSDDIYFIKSANEQQDRSITQLDNRVGTLETEITTVTGINNTQNARLSSLEGDRTYLLGQVATHDTKITGLETSKTSLEQRVTANESKLNNLNTEEWSTPVLQNGWRSHYEMVVGLRKDAMKNVQFKGQASGLSATSDVLFSLPPQHRPIQTMVFASTDGATITIDTSGTVYATMGKVVSLDCVYYPTI